MSRPVWREGPAFCSTEATEVTSCSSLNFSALGFFIFLCFWLPVSLYTHARARAHTHFPYLTPHFFFRPILLFILSRFLPTRNAPVTPTCRCSPPPSLVLEVPWVNTGEATIPGCCGDLLSYMARNYNLLVCVPQEQVLWLLRLTSAQAQCLASGLASWTWCEPLTLSKRNKVPPLQRSKVGLPAFLSSISVPAGKEQGWWLHFTGEVTQRTATRRWDPKSKQGWLSGKSLEKCPSPGFRAYQWVPGRMGV